MAEERDVVRYERVGQVAVITIDNPPVNALGVRVRGGLVAAVARFAAEDDATIAILLGAGRLFVGGADISEFGKPPLAPLLPQVIAGIEACPKPVVAALHGTALGGGLELALGCHYRLAMPGTRLGLPEVTLGLLPGAGGTQRVTRVAGVARAIELIAGGAPVTEAVALEMGVIDRIGAGDLRQAALDYAAEVLAAGGGPRRIRDLAPPAPDPVAVQAARARYQRGLPAPRQIVEAIEAATRLTFDEGLAVERRLFVDLMATPERAGLVHAFFAERRVTSLPGLAGIIPRPVTRIGVIGGGTMGAGIATAALIAGCHVILVERDGAALDRARATIDGNLGAAVKRGKLSEVARQAILADMVRFTTEYGDLAEVDLAIEAVFESMPVKTEVFAALDAVLRPGAILATNTSYLDVNEIAAATRRPGDVIGLHFFSPAHVMRLLEIVVAERTAPDVVATAFAFGKALGKVSVRSGVCDGFIGNRILAAYRGAADRMVLAGASPYQIDRALVDFGFAMGPYAVADLAGLDIGYMTRARKAASRDPRDIVPAWADDLYHLGRLGQKSGRGYYIYPERGRPGVPDPQVEALIDRHRAAAGLTPRLWDDAGIQRRYLAAMVNEAAKVVQEGIAARPLDVDAVLLFGYGFPRHLGGPMHWADQQGLAGLVADMAIWAQEDVFFWRPAPLLERLAAGGAGFASLNLEAAAG